MFGTQINQQMQFDQSGFNFNFGPQDGGLGMKPDDDVIQPKKKPVPQPEDDLDADIEDEGDKKQQNPGVSQIQKEEARMSSLNTSAQKSLDTVQLGTQQAAVPADDFGFSNFDQQPTNTAPATNFDAFNFDSFAQQ